MKIDFVNSFPHYRARPLLDDVFTFGRGGVFIACAFVTRPGVDILKQYSERLRHKDSFIVVANDWPTDIVALLELDRLCPGRIYVHLGYASPHERLSMSSLMHSKVFLSRCDNQARLWVGSHNLTAAATQGANCEAAIMVNAEWTDHCIQEAYQHLLSCKNESVYIRDVPPMPDPDPEPVDILIIHSETDLDLDVLPWHVHLRAPDESFDQMLSPSSDVMLFLYRPGD